MGLTCITGKALQPPFETSGRVGSFDGCGTELVSLRGVLQRRLFTDGLHVHDKRVVLCNGGIEPTAESTAPPLHAATADRLHNPTNNRYRHDDAHKCAQDDPVGHAKMAHFAKLPLTIAGTDALPILGIAGAVVFTLCRALCAGVYALGMLNGTTSGDGHRGDEKCKQDTDANVHAF